MDDDDVLYPEFSIDIELLIDEDLDKEIKYKGIVTHNEFGLLTIRIPEHRAGDIWMYMDMEQLECILAMARAFDKIFD